MKTFIGTKSINAKPMTRQQYIDLRNWMLPEDEFGDDQGYLVEYLDGGEPNTDEYDGYVSWSPKEVFEQSYRVAETFYDRLVIEESELATKLENLGKFLTTESFNKLPERQKMLIEQQGETMHKYLALLSQRITEIKI